MAVLGPSATPTDRQKWRIVRGVIMSGWGLTLLVIFAILGTALVLWYQAREVPPALIALAGGAAKALFDNSTVILRELMSDKAEP